MLIKCSYWRQRNQQNTSFNNNLFDNVEAEIRLSTNFQIVFTITILHGRENICYDVVAAVPNSNVQTKTILIL